MGKKVFEVAKELGVKHEALLKRCDDLGITAKNYMAELSDRDAARLRSAVEAENTRPADDKAGAPGVVRRRKAADPAPAPAPAARAMPLKATIPVATTPLRSAAPRPAAAPTPTTPPEPKPGPVVAERVSESAATRPADSPASEEHAAPRTATLAAEAAAVEAPRPAPEPERRPAPEPVATPPDSGEQAARAVRLDAPAPAVSAGPGTVVQPGATVISRPAPGSQAAPAGGAKILGTVPLDVLRSRTVRPQARRPMGPGPGGPGGPGGYGDRRPGGPGGPGGPSGPGGYGGPRRPPYGGGGGGRPLPLDVNQAVPLPVDKDGVRRRKTTDVPGSPEAREAERARAAGRAGAGTGPGGKKRQVVSREDIYAGGERGARGRKRKVSTKKGFKTQVTTPAAHKRIVKIDGTISVGELGKELGVKAGEIISKLIGMGMMVGINAQLDQDTASLIAADYGYEVSDVGFDEDDILESEAVEGEVDPDAVLRAPVVTVMGHVDHGKTSLLDRIRKAKVAAGEAGGITQHIGAYRVSTGHGDVVFLDTPGHAAFTAMRARGAQVTDLVVLVVAADDGVMPQTIEAINHARAAEVPIIVAINKMDKPGVDPERIKQELTKYQLVAEEWGGDTMMIPVSALKGDGVDTLLENLALQAEVLELRANPKKAAIGRVVEARMDKGRGPVVTALVQEGTLKVGDFVVSGAHAGRVRALVDDKGNRLKEAGPSTPVELLGLDGIPGAGDAFHVVENEKDAKRIAETRAERMREKDFASSASVSPADMLARMGKPDRETLCLILKADVQGSLEALKVVLDQIPKEEVRLKILHTGVGQISESDIMLAQASEAVCIGFNIGPDSNAKRVAEQVGVRTRRFDIIYEVADEVKKMMGGLLAPEIVETALGKAEVRAAFNISRIGPIAGCFVLDGKIVRNSRARVFRAGKLVAEGKLTSLKRFKDDIREVSTGYECGIAVEGYSDIQAGDVIEAVEIKEVARQIA